tara:strand:- start:272 stop:550 length:279 start_codon:yes stop_codon:yes gene_type:complete
MYGGNASIERYVLPNKGKIIAVSGGIDVGRIILRVTKDTQMSLSELELDFNYFLIPANTMMILDPPNLLCTSNLWFKLDGENTDGILEILRC